MTQLNNIIFSDDIELINIKDTDNKLYGTKYIIKLDGIKLELIVGSPNNIDDKNNNRLYWIEIRSINRDLQLNATRIYHKDNQTHSKPDDVTIVYSGFSMVSGNIYQLYLNNNQLSLQLCSKSIYTHLYITVKDCDKIHTIKIYDNDSDIIKYIDNSYS